MTVALILTGLGRYADPWHPYDTTSPLLAEILRASGIQAHIAPDVDDALSRLGSGHLPDLLVANLGRPQDGVPSPPAGPATAGLDRALGVVPLLAFHAAANSFPDSVAWERHLGARWVPGESHHPPFGPATIHKVGDADMTRGLGDFTVQDERYLGLRHSAGSSVLYEHDDEAGGTEPTVWVRTVDGARAAYDALGHDARSFDSPTHVEIISRLARWLVRR